MRGPFKKQWGKIAYTQKRQNAAHKQWESQQHADNLAAINRVANELAGTRQQEQRDDDKRAVREKLTIILLFATVFAAGLGDVFFYGQMQEMQRAYEPIRDSAEAAKTAAEAATEQSKIATRQVESSEKATIQAQRAWVGPTIAKIEVAPEVGKPIRVLIQYTNSGKEPALNFVYTGDIFAASPEDESNNVASAKVEAFFKGCREATNLRSGQVVFPNVGNAEGLLTFTSKDEFVDQSLIDGGTTLIAQGCFVYKSFNVIRHTYFCFFFSSKRSKIESLNYCANGAGAD